MRALVVVAFATACAPRPATRNVEPDDDAGVFVDAQGAPREDAASGDLPSRDLRSGDSSPDLTPQDRPRDAADGQPTSVWYGSVVVVGVGNDGRRLVSADGNSWTDIRDATGNRDGPKVLRAAAYANDVLVAVGGACAPVCTSRIMTFDGRSWTEINVPPGQGRLNGVAYGNGIWVAVGLSGPVLRSVDNGQTWTPTAFAGKPNGLRAVAFGAVGGKDMFVAVGEGYTRVRSLDGLNWSDVQAPVGTDGFNALAIAGNVAVAVGGGASGGRRMRSLNGTTWVDDQPGGPALISLVHDGKFMAYPGSADTVVFSSTDGRTWTMQNTTGAGSSVAVGTLGINNTKVFISRLAPGTVEVSSDGVAWTTKLMSSAGDATLNGFAFAGY